MGDATCPKCLRLGCRKIYRSGYRTKAASSRSGIGWVTRAKGNRRLSSRFEIGRRAEQVPAVREFTRPAEVVTCVKRLPRLSALQRQNPVYLPAFQHLSEALLARNRVR